MDRITRELVKFGEVQNRASSAFERVANALGELAALLRRRGPRLSRKRAVAVVRKAMGDGYVVKGSRHGRGCEVVVYRKQGPHATRKEDRVVIRATSWLGVRDAFHRMASAPAHNWDHAAAYKRTKGRKDAATWYSWKLRNLLDPVRRVVRKARRRGQVVYGNPARA